MINLAKPNIKTLAQLIVTTSAAIYEANAANEEPRIMRGLIDTLERLIDLAQNLGYEVTMLAECDSLRVELARKKLN